MLPTHLPPEPTPLHWCFLYYGKSQRQIAIWILEQTPELAEDVYEMDLYYGENVLHMAIIHRAHAASRAHPERYSPLPPPNST